MPDFYITSSWDDGSKHDLKLAELLGKYNIPATFYIAHEGFRGDLLHPSNIRRLSKNFEIGSHTLKHLWLDEVPDDKLEGEIIAGKKGLEDLIGKEVISFCYPWGVYNSKIKQAVGLQGFKFARTTKAFATSILDLLAAPITVHAYDDDIVHSLVHGHKILLRKLFYYALLKKGLNFRWDDLSILFADYCMKNGGVFHLYGHSWEIEKTNNWKRLERVLRYLNENTNSTQSFTNGGLALKTENTKKKYYSEFDALRFDTEYQTPYYRKEIEIVGNMVKRFDKPQAKILDIGCGSGRLSSLFNKATYLGMDYSDNLIKYAKKEYGAPNRKFVCEDYWKSNKGKSVKYDLILLWGFIEDEVDPFRVITSLLSIVKKGTRVVFTLQNAENLFFKSIKYIRNEYFNQPYSLTSFDGESLEPYIERYCRKNNYHYQLTSLGLINPSHKLIPFIPAGSYGNTLVYIFDKV